METNSIISFSESTLSRTYWATGRRFDPHMWMYEILFKIFSVGKKIYTWHKTLIKILLAGLNRTGKLDNQFYDVKVWEKFDEKV